MNCDRCRYWGKNAHPNGNSACVIPECKPKPVEAETWTNRVLLEICTRFNNNCDRIIGTAEAVNARLRLTDTDFQYFGWYAAAQFLATCLWNGHQVPEVG